MNRNIRTTAVYILNNFKCVHNKSYFEFSISIRKDFCAADLIIKNMKLIKNFQTNTYFDDDFIENFSVLVNRIDIIKIDISISSTRAIVFKFLISKIVSVISRKASQVENINQLNKSNVVLSVVNSISSQVRFFNFNKKIFAFFINQDNQFTEHEF